MKCVSYADRRCIPSPGKKDLVSKQITLTENGVVVLSDYESIPDKYKLHPELFGLDYDTKSGFNLSPTPMMDLSSFEAKLNNVESQLANLKSMMSTPESSDVESSDVESNNE